MIVMYVEGRRDILYVRADTTEEIGMDELINAACGVTKPHRE